MCDLCVHLSRVYPTLFVKKNSICRFLLNLVVLVFAGEFPTLQNKMRAILRIEVEAVRFLKEEPHKLDSLLKRVRSMTDILTTLRR